jgi:ribonuclease BN (tRNA processing enzyme)
MDGAHFPVFSADVPSQPRCVTEAEVDFLRSRGFRVSTIAANHPGGSFGYKVENAGRSFVYLTDNELDPPYKKATDFRGFIEFCRNADVLVHDAQYLDRDMPHKHGWGHSLVRQARDLALQANVKHLVLYHHDPDRTDEELDRIQEESRSWFEKRRAAIECTVAFEGLSMVV